LAELSFIYDVVYGMVTSGFFWGAIIIGGLIAMLFGLNVKKKRRMDIHIIKVVNLGNDKVAFQETKGGFFRKNRMLFGLWETGGDYQLITKDDDVVYGSEASDYHEFNKKKCLFVTPNPDDLKMLFPLRKFNLSEKTKEILTEIAPIEVRESAVDCYKQTTKEMKDWREQIVQWVLIGLFFIVAFLVIMFITQYGKHIMDKASEMNAQSIEGNRQIADKLVEAMNKITSSSSGAP